MLEQYMALPWWQQVLVALPFTVLAKLVICFIFSPITVRLDNIEKAIRGVKK